MQAYLIKSISALQAEGQPAIVDIDTKTRTIVGYASIFGNIDSDRDMVMPGAFTKTLSENASRAKHLWQHDVRYPLARPKLETDNIGLKFQSIFSDTSWGRDAIQLYQDGVIDEHSIGYQTVKQQKKDGYNALTELKLWEISSVTWGANSLAIGGPAKSAKKEDIISRMDAIYKALRHGKYENEEIFEQLDIYHQQLKQLIIDLSVNTPAVEQTQEPEETKSVDNDTEQKIQSLIQLFK